MSFTLMRMLPAGAAIWPDIGTVCVLLAISVEKDAELITVVPSHNLMLNVAAPAVSLMVTCPLANHVPDVPCATLGPSKKVETLLSVTFATSTFAIGAEFTDITPAAAVMLELSTFTVPNCDEDACESTMSFVELVMPLAEFSVNAPELPAIDPTPTDPGEPAVAKPQSAKVPEPPMLVTAIESEVPVYAETTPSMKFEPFAAVLART
jgi:hypothetical protein